ncbi:MAG: hypothetical protein KW788_03825 [Candidatus Doudnabacteria bacterium]|nr:hypothetical protein [Candidatus Doudnabacteria bacterium]
MKKNLILVLSLVFVAASCNWLTGASGAMGVLRSEDSGGNFSPRNSIDNKTNLNSVSVNDLVFEPGNSQNLYLASAAGAFKSTDAGQSWKILLTNILVADLSIDAQDTSTIYVVGSSDNHGKIVKTTDGGGSWKDIYTEPTTGDSVMSIAVDPTNHMHLLAGLKAGEIIQSLDAGTTWQVAADLHDQVSRVRYGVNKRPYVLAYNYGLYESKDGSSNFTNLTGTLTNGLVNFNSNFSAVSNFLDLAFDVKQTGVLYLATDVGLLRTINDGAEWSYMSMPVRNSVLRTSAIGVNPKDSNNLYAVVGSTLFKSINGGVTWETKPLPSGQEVRQILIDASSPNVIYLGLGVRK